MTGVLTTVAAAVIAAWTTRRALRPVAEMAATAAEWSEHDLSRRFDLGAPDNEISALADTLDQLLDKVSSAIRSEQRLTSELAHELRTPLTTIHGTADLVLLRDVLSAATRRDIEEISTASQRMAATISALLELARNEATVVSAGRCSLADVLAEIADDAGDTAATLSIDASDVLLDLPHALAVRAISPVVENALRFARRQVRISDTTARGLVEVAVEDDGPGVAVDEAELVFEPGARSSSGSGPAPVSVSPLPVGSRGPSAVMLSSSGTRRSPGSSSDSREHDLASGVARPLVDSPSLSSANRLGDRPPLSSTLAASTQASIRPGENSSGLRDIRGRRVGLQARRRPARQQP